MTGGGGLIVKVSVALPVPPALVALMVTLYVPAVVGVPEITLCSYSQLNQLVARWH